MYVKYCPMKMKLFIVSKTRWTRIRPSRRCPRRCEWGCGREGPRSGRTSRQPRSSWLAQSTGGRESDWLWFGKAQNLGSNFSVSFQLYYWIWFNCSLLQRYTHVFILKKKAYYWYRIIYFTFLSFFPFKKIVLTYVKFHIQSPKPENLEAPLVSIPNYLIKSLSNTTYTNSNSFRIYWVKLLN